MNREAPVHPPFIPRPRVVFADPDSLPLPDSLGNHIVVCDISFALPVAPSEFPLHHEKTGLFYRKEMERTTLSFIRALGDRLTLWIDHHSHEGWNLFRNDRRFLFVPPSEAPACAAVIDERLFSRCDFTDVDTLICHGDLDGIISAARFLLRGKRPYRNACEDAIAADTRHGRLSRTGMACDRALRATADDTVRMAVLGSLISGDPLSFKAIRDIAGNLKPLSRKNRRLVKEAHLTGAVRIADCRSEKSREADNALNVKSLDMTGLLCALERGGQAGIAIYRHKGEELIAVAAPWKDMPLPELFGLPGGSAQRVTLQATHLPEAVALLENQAPLSVTTLPGPLRATVEVTRRCTLHCPLCPVGNGTARPMEDMSSSTFRSIIDTFACELGSLTLHNYGEPLLHPEIASFIDYAKISGIPDVALTSNGNNLTERMAHELVESGLDVIRISADTADPEAYTVYRQGGSLEKVLECITLLRSIRQRMGKDKPLIEAQALLMRSNEDSLPQFNSVFLGAGADSVRCKTFNVFMSGSEMGERGKEFLSLNRGYRRYRTMNPEPAGKAIAMKVCNWPWNDLVVLADATVVPCCHDYDGEFPLGRAGKASFREVWNTEARKVFMARRILQPESMAMCCRCSSAVPELSAGKEVSLTS